MRRGKEDCFLVGDLMDLGQVAGRQFSVGDRNDEVFGGLLADGVIILEVSFGRR